MNQTIVAVLLTFLFVASCGRDEQHYVADCRDAGLRVAGKYKGELVLNRDIHYNRKTHGCYLSLNYSTKDEDAPGTFVWNQEVQDVNENRILFECKMPAMMSPVCVDFRTGDMEQLDYLDYDKLRKQYMEY